MKNQFNLRAKDHILTREGKRRFNEEHFSESAPRYDLATRLLSLGQDGHWKRQLAKGLPEMESPSCLDIACGTGDVAFLLADKYPKGEILGIDLTQNMIDIANQRNSRASVSFARQRMCHLDLADNSVDIITGSYAIRNAPILGEALAEFQRVLKPGGHALFLDFSKPASKLGQKIQYGILKFWGGLWGLVLHGNPQVHGYISESLRAFPEKERLEKSFLEHGFSIETATSFFSGMTILYFLKLDPQPTKN